MATIEGKSEPCKLNMPDVDILTIDAGASIA